METHLLHFLLHNVALKQLYILSKHNFCLLNTTNSWNFYSSYISTVVVTMVINVKQTNCFWMIMNQESETSDKMDKYCKVEKILPLNVWLKQQDFAE